MEDGWWWLYQLNEVNQQREITKFLTPRSPLSKRKRLIIYEKSKTGIRYPFYW